MELGREATRGGIGTVVIIPRNIQVSPRIAYTVTRRHSYELSSTHALFLFSIQRVVLNLLHNLIAILHPPPTAVLSSACRSSLSTMLDGSIQVVQFVISKLPDNFPQEWDAWM
jgi:hypothetical protein